MIEFIAALAVFALVVSGAFGIGWMIANCPPKETDGS